jgi:hypothetical protein
MTEEEQQIVEAMLRDLIRLTRPSGPGPAKEGPLSPEEMEALLTGLNDRNVLKSPDAQDEPALPDQLD